MYHNEYYHDENTDTNNGNPYAGAKVTVTYPQSGSTPVTNEATTTDDGKFNISIGDWTLNTDNKYTVFVAIKKYEHYKHRRLSRKHRRRHVVKVKG